MAGMPHFSYTRRVQLACVLAPFALITGRLWASSGTVVISQVYTAGGNSGATYNADYVEIFNLSNTPVSLNGYALQYFSATASATSTPVVSTLPAGVTLQPGQRYLVEATPSTTSGVATVNAADYIASNLAMGAAAGRIYLTSSTAALSNANGCPTNYVDFVGYGTTANCYEGTRAAAPSLSQPIARTNACVDADNNGTEFALTSTAARDFNSAPTSCFASASLLSSAAATPSTVTAGSATLLTATGATGLTVLADLSAFSGGSSAQPLYDDGTHGDLTASDGTYSYGYTVPSSAGAANYTVNVAAKNSALQTGTASLSLMVQLPQATTPIHTIQGTTPGASPYAGQTVTTSGIVIDVLTSGFHLQSRDSADDSDPNTPEGIYVYTGSGKVPATVTVGTEIQVTGKVAIYPAATVAAIGGTELDSPTNITMLSAGNALPAAITLTTADPSPSGGIAQLPHLQSMRVAAPSLTVTQPTDGNLTEVNETYVSNGQFWGEITGVPRPIREPGLDIRDPFTASQPATIPRFDSDPETFLVDALAAQGGTAGTLDVSTGTVITGVTGTMDLSSSTGLPRLIIDAKARPTSVTGGASVVTVRAAAANEITIGDQNMERFYNATGDSNGALTVTPAAYALRLAKASLGIRTVLNTPDILAMEEMEDLQTLTDLSARISADAVAAGQPDPQYKPYLTQGNDSSGINVCFLVKPSKVDVLSVVQYGLTITYTTPTGGSSILNDRPPLVLHAGIKRTGGAADYPVTVIVNHLRSLLNITDPATGATVRAKREAQAEYLANLVQSFQSAGEHVVVVGDFNAFEVNDGLVDSLGVIRGNPAPASQDVVAGAANLVYPYLIDTAPTNLSTNDYSYVFDGYAQSIDHFLVTQDIAAQVRTQPAHWNADFPVVDRNNATIPQVSTDHDGLVGFLSVPNATPVSGTVNLVTSPVLTKNTDGSYTVTVTITNSGTGTAQAVQLTSATLGMAADTSPLPVNAGDIQPNGSTTLTLVFGAAAGSSGSRVIEKVTGTYTGGSFGGSLRATLP